MVKQRHTGHSLDFAGQEPGLRSSAKSLLMLNRNLSLYLRDAPVWNRGLALGVIGRLGYRAGRLPLTCYSPQYLDVDSPTGRFLFWNKRRHLLNPLLNTQSET